MKIRFNKFEGTGNDFIIIDNRKLNWLPGQQEVALLCHRHFGIGADGLMLLSEKQGFDFAMTYYNSDGLESTMCGNGGRCITAFAESLGLIKKTAEFHAIDGPHQSVIISASPVDYLIKLKMRDTEIGRIMDDGIFIDTGSPHFVTERENVREMDVFAEGRKLRFDERFLPGGSNIDFLEPGGEKLFVRTYERGVEDETLSCGTGVTASALVTAYLQKKSTGFYLIDTPGGALKVFFNRDEARFTDVWLEGDVRRVFEGEIEK